MRIRLGRDCFREIPLIVSLRLTVNWSFRSSLRLVFALAVASFFSTWLSAAEDQSDKPVSHTTKVIEGWTVQVDDRLLTGTDARLGERAINILTNRLSDVKTSLPIEKWQRLQRVPIWLDRNHGALKSAQYHPGAGWLKEHGYSEQLAKSVHIPDAAQFFEPRHQFEQPWAVMHELAHAYHDQVLDFEQPAIKDAWRRFQDGGRYKQVQHINGRQHPHYALTNQMEFFAEMTESYLGMNDFFPFNRAELEREEPEIFLLMQETWDSALGQ